MTKQICIGFKPSVLLAWRIFLVSILIAAFAWFFGFWYIVAFALIPICSVMLFVGSGTLFQRRDGFTRHDNFMATVVGSGLIALAVGILFVFWRYL